MTTDFRRWRALIVALVAAAGLGAARDRAAHKVDTWHDRAVDFDAHRTFDTEPVPPGTAARLARGIRTLEDQVRDAAVAAFETRGYVYDPDADRVDFILVFAFDPPANPRGRKQRLGLRQTIDGSGPFVDITVNHLYVELRDPESGFPVWRGRSQRVLGKRPEEDAARIDAAAGAIARAFPPEPYRAPADGADGAEP